LKAFQKILREISIEIDAFENELKFLRDQRNDIVDLRDSPWKIVMQRATVKQTYEKDNIILMKGEVIQGHVLSFPVGKIAKKKCEGAQNGFVNSALKIQYHIVKNTLLQTASSAILPIGLFWFNL